MARNTVRGYTLRDDYGKIVYVGTSDNVRARRAEHRLNGKQFKELKVETGPMSRKEAERWEYSRLKSYRNFTGRNPQYNKTESGGFEKKRQSSANQSSRPKRGYPRAWFRRRKR